MPSLSKLTLCCAALSLAAACHRPPQRPATAMEYCAQLGKKYFETKTECTAVTDEVALGAMNAIELAKLMKRVPDPQVPGTDKLIDMGARIILCDPHRAIVVGGSPLYGSKISSPDIRAGMALLIAALCAKGESVIQNVQQIDRGYERIDERLGALGARIRREQDR